MNVLVYTELFKGVKKLIVDHRKNRHQVYLYYNYDWFKVCKDGSLELIEEDSFLFSLVSKYELEERLKEKGIDTKDL